MEYTKQEFLELIKQELQVTNTSQEDFKNIKLCIHRIRLYNTIGIYKDLRYNKDCLLYSRSFFDNYLKKMVEEMKCSVSTGMGFYCKDYNISIGGIPNNQSFYIIKNIRKEHN